MAERWVQVPTLRGLQQMRLRRGALSYRIKSAGLPWQDGGRCADGIVNVVPVFPPDLDAAQEGLVEALVASNTGRLGTEAAARAAAWQARVEGWQARAGVKAPPRQ
jgi:DnaJ-class molecular chaperone